MTHRYLLGLLVLLTLASCAKDHPVPERPVPEKPIPDFKPGPILYHRTGGIAGTDDRVVIWPDGFVEIHGKILTDGEGWIAKESMNQLWGLVKHWHALQDEYLPPKPVMDAYTITITFDGKTVAANDLAPQLPDDFRNLFSTIETIAGEISAEPKPAP